jgi:hypothetical protein
MQLTPAIEADAGLVLESSRELGGGSIELVYSCRGSRSDLPERPASQR